MDSGTKEQIEPTSGSILGIDLGTTSVKIVILDIDTHSVLHSSNQKTEADVESDAGKDGYEQDVRKIISVLEGLLSDIPWKLKPKVQRIGITGQMHGLVLWGRNARQTSNLYTWQDQRASQCFISTLLKAKSHIQLASGFGIVTYLWLLKHRKYITEKFHWIGTIVDYLIYDICCLEHPVTSCHLAASVGYFNTDVEEWNCDLLEQQGFPVDRLPKIAEPGKVVGQLQTDWCGMKKGTPVLVGLGDTQCSFLSSLIATENTALLNIGTSLQLGCVVKTKTLNQPALQFFPYFEGNYLALAASLNGGNVIHQFVLMMSEWVRLFDNKISNEQVWQKMFEEADKITKDDRLEIKPTFFGERHQPSELGIIQNISPPCLNVARMFHSLCYGVINNAVQMMPLIYLRSNEINVVMGTGSVISKNPVIQSHMVKIFEEFSVVNNVDCDAATGAALCAFKYYKA